MSYRIGGILSTHLSERRRCVEKTGVKGFTHAEQRHMSYHQHVSVLLFDRVQRVKNQNKTRVGKIDKKRLHSFEGG